VTVLGNGDLQLNTLTLSGDDELEPITLDERCVFDRFHPQDYPHPAWNAVQRSVMLTHWSVLGMQRVWCPVAR